MPDQINKPGNQDTFGMTKSAKNPQKAASDQEEYEAMKAHSNSGSNTHSGQGMEYVDRKNISGEEAARRAADGSARGHNN